jgi:hypothetical protein
LQVENLLQKKPKNSLFFLYRLTAFVIQQRHGILSPTKLGAKDAAEGD